MDPSGPTHFGPYLVRGVLGQGGMGTVFLGWDPAHEQEVAVKTLAGGQAAGENSRRRFQREIRALARIQHPGLVPILNAGEESGVPWFAMPRIAGGSLEDRLRDRGPLSLEESLELGLQLCRALDVAHQAGILHRDLKPDNVLCPEPGRFLVTDFGLAKDLVNEASVRLSKTGALQGTPGFWAPEQAAGRASGSSVATDVYGLGALLYAALTGVAPLQAESLVLLIMATMETPPAPPSESGDSCPALDALLLRCLAKSPADRPAGLGEVATELSRLQGLGREALLLEPRSGTSRGWIVALGAGVTLALLGAAGAWASRAPAEPTPTPSATPVLDGPMLLAAAQEAFAAERSAEGLDLLRQAASNGHAPALHALGRRHQAGEGLARDPAEALRCYRAAAEAGLVPAMIDLGLALEAGLDEDSDAVEAVSWYRQAAAAGAPEAKLLLADALLAGEAVGEDPEAAAALIHEAAEEGEPRAMFRYGRHLARKTPGQEGLRAAGFWYRKAAEAGEPLAMVQLGEALSLGWGMERDLAEAGRWYRRAADLGSPVGRTAYALALIKGRGVTQDKGEGVRLLRRDAQDGHALAMVRLGDALRAGDGVPKDEKQALEWYRRAVALEEGAAMYAMAAFYMTKDRAEAARWIERGARLRHPRCVVQHLGLLVQRGELARALPLARAAAEAGDPEAMLFFAELSMQSDPKEAQRWYRRAAELGQTNAMVNLAYRLSRGSPANRREALVWYRRAAEGGAVQGLVNLAGLLSEGGKGIDRDPAEALRLYRRAAELGSDQGMLGVANCYRLGIGTEKDLAKAEEWKRRADGVKHKSEGGLIDMASEEYSRGRFESAAAIYRRAVNQGSPIAKHRLADLMANGRGVPKDEAKARALLVQSVNAGYLPAMATLASWLLKGRGGPKDATKGQRLMLRAAEAGDVQAIFFHANWLELGTPEVPKDTVAALKRYRQVVDSGSLPASSRVLAAAREAIKRLEGAR